MPVASRRRLRALACFAVAATAAVAWSQPQLAGPSFDCSKAASDAEKLICADGLLSRLDRELAVQYAAAKARASDPAKFRRQGIAEWKLREGCKSDRDCLVLWYAKRSVDLSR